MTLREKLIEDPAFSLEHNLFYQKSFPGSLDFEKAYLQQRQIENRLLEDAEVAILPHIKGGNSLRSEWKVRKKSLERLLKYLKTKDNPGRLLEVGCGNGWLSNQLVSRTSFDVMGIDINEHELLQAARIFNKENLNFIYGDIFTLTTSQRFDVIILASVIQYFQNLPALISKLLALLEPKGEIHILDSPLYRGADVANARERSRSYFEIMVPEMADHYFHHSLEDLSAFNPDFLYNPMSITARIARQLNADNSPFPWIRIKK